MNQFFLYFREIVLFALPVIIGQMGHTLFGVVDIVVAGRFSTETVAALGIATALTTPFLIVGLGITYAISPRKARAIAAGEPIDHYPATATVLGVIVGLIGAIAIAVTASQIDLFAFEPTITSDVKTYLFITAISFIPAILFQVFRENFQAREKTILANMLILIFNGINLFLNILFLFKLNLGITGLALATTISRFAMAAVMGIAMVRHIPIRFPIDKTLLAEFFRKGVPIGLSGVATALGFTVVTLLAGKMELPIIAANNIMITITGMTYMIPYALAGAISVKIGKLCGESRYDQVRPYAVAGTAAGVFSAAIMAICFALFPEQILSVATADREVIAVGTALLVAVAIYQIPDTIQEVMVGSLRGIGKTTTPMFYLIGGFWGIGFPVGLWLAFEKGLDAVGLWYGLAIGLTVIAILQVQLFMKSTVQESESIAPCTESVS